MIKTKEMKFKHYILCRFNLGIYDKPDADEWMEHRMKLFEKFTIASWMEQSNTDSTLILGFDERTPESIIKRYDYIEGVVIVYEQPHLWLRLQRPEADWIITSRLDNDDQLHEDYVYEIQKEFREKLEVIDVEYQAVNLSSGEKFTSERHRPNSPFLSLVEPWDNIKTAMARPHTNMPDEFPARKIDKVLAYMIIHDRNVCNKIVGKKI